MPPPRSHEEQVRHLKDINVMNISAQIVIKTILLSQEFMLYIASRTSSRSFAPKMTMCRVDEGY